MACIPVDETYRNGVDGTGSTHRRKIGSCQPKPYVRPLPYTFKFIRTTKATMTGVFSTFGEMANADFDKGVILPSPNLLVNDTAYTGNLVTQCINKALDKFYDQLDEQAMLAVNYAERKQASAMMAARLFQLARFGRALRKFDLVTAAKSLGLDPNSGIPTVYRKGQKPRGWSNAKARSKIVANAWLEFHFGWEPVVKDIFHAIQVLQAPMTGKTFWVDATLPIKFSWRLKTGATSYLREAEGFVNVKVGSTLAVTDSNAYMANRLGLTNPAAWAWELIPFSFVVDWFATVGNFINQWTDLDGVRLIDPWYATTCNISRAYYAVRYSSSAIDIWSTGFYFQRALGLPRYKIAFRPMKRLSVVRAATAIALLVQFLPR